MSWWRSAMISASRAARDLKSPMTTHQISFSISPMRRSIARFAALRQWDKVYDKDTVRVESAIVEHVIEAAKIADMDPALLMAIADKESRFAPKVKASTSSASGLFQFVEPTWFKALRSFGWRHGYMSRRRRRSKATTRRCASRRKSAQSCCAFATTLFSQPCLRAKCSSTTAKASPAVWAAR
jgi:hypothetical protein